MSIKKHLYFHLLWPSCSGRNTGWSSYQRICPTETSATSLLPQASLWSHKRQRRCWSQRETDLWVSLHIHCQAYILVSNNGIMLVFCVHTPDVRLRKLADEKDELLSQVWLYMKWIKMYYWHCWVEVTHLRSFRSENWRSSWRKKDKSTQRSTVFTWKESEWRTALTCISSRCRVRPVTRAVHTLMFVLTSFTCAML